jgi:aryl-alcohol dehydrogenase-like predicted oxidoreductase
MLGRPPSADRPDDDACTSEDYYIGMVHAALEVGVDLIDTANSYQDGRSETLVGKALLGRRDSALIATKCGSRNRDFSADGICREAEASLQRLQTDRIDLLQLHNPSSEDMTSLDWLRGFARLRAEGSIRFAGISVGSPDQGVWLAERGLVDAVQVNFNVFRPEARDALLPLARERQMAVIVKIPLARGLLSGKYGSATRFPDGDWHRQGFVGNEAEMLDRIDRLKEIARAAGVTMPQLALGWVLSHDGVSVAIPGAKRVEHVRDNAAAGELGGLPEPVFAEVERAAGR